MQETAITRAGDLNRAAPAIDLELDAARIEPMHPRKMVLSIHLHRHAGVALLPIRHLELGFWIASGQLVGHALRRHLGVAPAGLHAAQHLGLGMSEAAGMQRRGDRSHHVLIA